MDVPLAPEVAASAEIGLAVLLVLGMWVVRRGYVHWHAWIQSTAILVNIPIVLVWMVPQYLVNVLPDLPGELDQPFYLLPTIAVFAGGLAEALGVYILLVAGTNWVPERYRFRRYKLWMRTELVLWWLVVALGLGIYLTWYVVPAAGGS